MASDCIFCRIAAGEIPSKSVFRDDEVVAIEDVNPQAPTHVLVMPLRHYANVGEMADGADPAALGRLLAVASRVGRERGGDGYRLTINTGSQGGQTVDHLHVHVMAGRQMSWPPG
ncbi:MAG: histidine triad nucleotide-binding protein [Candidatus Eremiobacteraeota bacterium]|nr:histidine triad nucleotide-binding protein [Candidatus Eremiobacteraeota bacterium]